MARSGIIGLGPTPLRSAWGPFNPLTLLVNGVGQQVATIIAPGSTNAIGFLITCVVKAGAGGSGGSLTFQKLFTWTGAYFGAGTVIATDSAVPTGTLVADCEIVGTAIFMHATATGGADNHHATMWVDVFNQDASAAQAQVIQNRS